jgi:hypothetical protein
MVLGEMGINPSYICIIQAYLGYSVTPPNYGLWRSLYNRVTWCRWDARICIMGLNFLFHTVTFGPPDINEIIHPISLYMNQQPICQVWLSIIYNNIKIFTYCHAIDITELWLLSRDDRGFPTGIPRLRRFWSYRKSNCGSPVIIFLITWSTQN